MNLAQLIDPSSVWRDSDRPSAPRVNPAPRVYDKLAPEIRKAMRGTRDAGPSLSLAEIRGALSIPLTSIQVAQNVFSLFRVGDIDRTGDPGAYRYWLTEQGRARLAA